MELVFVALPVALVIGGAALVAFAWAAKDDQFEDLDTPPRRAIFDEIPAKDAAEAGVPDPAPTETSADSRQP
ncbi:MAG: cbb3-type cytochrome oxidase assembly protein CcoS [Phycisphaera sp.]|nr:cbb3-type cytochrome oxidase assembly protein CcoS [Phycisphaera sp.]